MKVLVINGSPRGTHGTTWWVLDRLIQGMEEAGAEIQTIHLAGKKIGACTGELDCWFRTPGQCIHNDDMEEVLAAIPGAETLVVGTPVYVDGMTGLLKNCIDRLVPLVDPHLEFVDAHLRHPRSEHLPKRIALAATCGLIELDNFDPLVAHVRAICRNAHAEFAGAVLRPAAPPLPHVGILHPFKIHTISKAIRRAGLELARDGRISDAAAEEAAAEVFAPEDYRKHANHSFDKLLLKARERG